MNEVTSAPEGPAWLNYFLMDHFSWHALGLGFLYLAVMLLLLLLGKKIYAAFAPFDLDQELTEKDNKAVLVSFAGFMFALGLVLHAVLSGEAHHSLVRDLGETLLWCLIGTAMLLIAHWVNDHWIFGGFSNQKELAEDRNVGLGAAEAGSYIGTGLILRACLSGEAVSFWTGLIGAVLFFVFGQIAFVLFAEFYQRITRFDFKKSIENDNPAVGTSFGLSLVAFGNLLSAPILVSDSLTTLILWALLGALLFAVARAVLDRVVLPGSRLDDEIHRDKNWGASLLIGSMFVLISMLVNSAFL